MWIDDEILRECHAPLVIKTWIPESTVVVLGSSNKAEAEINLTACLQDDVPVLKRYGGGGSVVLHGGCVVVGVGAWVSHPFDNPRYFRLLNQALIDALAGTWPELAALEQNGVSDIVWRDKKIAGTSLFRSRGYLLYQASVLVDPDTDLIARYLAHPPKEPTYRRGRPHAEFVTGLVKIAPALKPLTVLRALQTALPEVLSGSLKAEAIAPVAAHFPNLLKRANAES